MRDTNYIDEKIAELLKQEANKDMHVARKGIEKWRELMMITFGYDARITITPGQEAWARGVKPLNLAIKELHGHTVLDEEHAKIHVKKNRAEIIRKLAGAMRAEMREEEEQQ